MWLQCDNPPGKGRALLVSLVGGVFPGKRGWEENVSVPDVSCVGEVSGGAAGYWQRVLLVSPYHGLAVKFPLFTNAQRNPK